MKDVTNPKYQSKINWSKSPSEEFIASINENQDDYVELLKCNSRHWILRGWYVEAHYPSQNHAMKDLPRFVDEDIKKSLKGVTTNEKEKG